MIMMYVLWMKKNLLCIKMKFLIFTRFYYGFLNVLRVLLCPWTTVRNVFNVVLVSDCQRLEPPTP